MTRIRTAEPCRSQGVIHWELPEDTLPQDHRARLLWRVVETLDLSRFTRNAKAIEGVAGRRALSTRMLLTLWLYAISIGIGSAREIARRVVSDTVFRWIVGDQRVGHSKLSEFRGSHREALDHLLTDILGTLIYRELITLDVVAQDGTRVRANAAGSSFRRASTLEQCREQAALHVKAVLAEADDPETSSAEFKARLAAARDYERRIGEAIAVVQDLQLGGKDEPRASTTDAEARIMKMADGGFRPGYNVQLATVGSEFGGARTVVGVRVTNVGTDRRSITPMLNEIERRTGRLPSTILADGDHATVECITNATQRGVVPVIASKKKEDHLLPPKLYAYDTKEMIAWRERMKQGNFRALYRVRAGLCEFTNARLKSTQGIQQFLVRSIEKVTCVALLAALSANIVSHASALLTL